jgi:hypothetical protein
MAYISYLSLHLHTLKNLTRILQASGLCAFEEDKIHRGLPNHCSAHRNDSSPSRIDIHVTARASSQILAP